MPLAFLSFYIIYTVRCSRCFAPTCPLPSVPKAWFTYLTEGLYLDQHTRTTTAELVTYNAQLRIFSYYYIKFDFSDGGSIKVRPMGALCTYGRALTGDRSRHGLQAGLGMYP